MLLLSGGDGDAVWCMDRDRACRPQMQSKYDVSDTETVGMDPLEGTRRR